MRLLDVYLQMEQLLCIYGDGLGYDFMSVIALSYYHFISLNK